MLIKNQIYGNCFATPITRKSFKFTLTNEFEKINAALFFGYDYVGAYMRPEMKSARNEILIHHKRNYVSITFHCGRKELKLRSGIDRKEKRPIQ